MIQTMDVMFHFYLSEKDVPLSNVLSDLGYSICQSTVNVCVSSSQPSVSLSTEDYKI